MRRLLGIPLLLTAAVAAAVSLYLGFTAPAPATDLGPTPAAFVTGAYHVHSDRSDGTGTVAEIAGAAARAGLAFVILTDHGDLTRPVDPPAYLHGVLMIDAVEINTTAGHLVALGLENASPYPLAGHPRDVIEDVHRMGGSAVMAHPDSPSDGLRWRGPNAAVDGIEWMNVDAEWRDESPWRLFATAARSLIRGPEAIASLFSRPARSLARLDAAARERPVFGLAALDAHANIAWRDREEPRQRSILRRPTYEAMFRTLSQAVWVGSPLSGAAAADAKRVVDAMRLGRSFSIVSAYAAPASLLFTARQADAEVQLGGRLAAGVDTSFHAAVPQTPGARLSLLADGKPVATGQGSVRFEAAGRPGVYRVEVAWPGAPAPWIISNPIVLERPPPPDIVEPGTAERADDQRFAISTSAPEAWTVEREPASAVDLAAEGDSLEFSFVLADGVARGQYAAVSAPITTTAGIDGVGFRGSASAPMRISVQLRLPGGSDGRRWRRSVYLDRTPRDVVIRLQDFDPVEPYTSQRPIVSPAESLLFVVDTLNTLPGTRGTLWIADVHLTLRAP